MAVMHHIGVDLSGNYVRTGTTPIGVAHQGNDNSWLHNQFDAARDNRVASVDVAAPSRKQDFGMKI